MIYGRFSLQRQPGRRGEDRGVPPFFSFPPPFFFIYGKNFKPAIPHSSRANTNYPKPGRLLESLRREISLN